MKPELDRVAARPLRWLTQLGGTDLLDRLRLRGATERALHGVGVAAGKVMTPAPSKQASGDPARLATAPRGAVFDLTPTEEQDLIRQTARRCADEVLRPRAAAADGQASPDAAALAAVHALGLAALVVPEAHGGMAETRAVVSTALVIEELARGDMGLALASLAPLGVAAAIVEWGSAEQQARWLPRFVGDDVFGAALAVLEPRPGSDPARPMVGAVRAPGGWRLHGTKALVPLAASAQLFLVLADIRGAGARLFVVPRETPGVTTTPQPAMGLRGAGLGELRLDAAFVPNDALLGGDDAIGAFDPQAVVDRARIAWGAMAVGGARAVLEYTTTYCNDRKAFGEPISHRQAVAFLIADLAIELEGMRLLVHRAASLADAGEPYARAATLAHIQCAAKAMKAGTDGVQLLGGHGFVKDHPVERWYRDLRAIAVMEGALL